MATLYMSTDPGAPQLSGLAGSLVTLLDAVLVDGYGAGVDRRNGAGWTKAFTGTNKRAYRNSAVSGTGFYLQVEDPGASGTAGYAFVRGFSTMTAFDTGLNPTPAVASLANGVVVAKSSVLDGGSRQWLILADERIVYIFINPWPTANYYHPYFFGDFISYKAGDANNWCIASNGLSSSTPRLRPIHSPPSTFSAPRFSPTYFPSVVGTAYSIGAGATQSCTAALTFPRSSTPTTKNFMSSMRRSTRHVPSARDRVIATTSKVRRSRIMILPIAGWFKIRSRPSGASGSLEPGALPARYPKPAHWLPMEH